VVTRLSQLFVRTLREDPSDAEVRSHKLLVRAGYIRRQAPGVFAWLPLGLRVKARLEQIVREEMGRAGAQEVHFPALMPRDPYEQTGRWEEYGDNLFRLQDRHGADYLLAPTHEEAFTLLVKDLYNSYKDLPLTIYQIQDKYRDEARPRAGLLRGREFTMKDAFTRLGMEYVIVKADAGAMGGSRSEEFLHPTPVGEDTFVRSAGGYAANVEAFTTLAPEPIDYTDAPAPVVYDSPGTKTIETLVAHANEALDDAPEGGWTAAHMLKNVVLAVTHPDGEREIVVVAIPGDREIEEKRLEVAFSPAEAAPASAEDLAKIPALVPGFIGPWTADGALLGEESKTGIRYLVDPRIVDGTSWITGANEADKHVRGVVAGRDFTADGTIEVANVREGDPAPDGSGPVTLERGMEIGHIFQLGRKYAEALGLKVLDENGKLQTVTMGSYGIGVTRVMAAIAELSSDDKGLIWPESIAPFDVHVVATGKGQEAYDLAAELIEGLEKARMDVLFDDRPKVSPGVKFGDAELLGVPQLVVAGRGAADGEVELWDRRTGERETMPLAEALSRLTA
jgi:prolyl-tRNA synthetase